KIFAPQFRARRRPGEKTRWLLENSALSPAQKLVAISDQIPRNRSNWNPPRQFLKDAAGNPLDPGAPRRFARAGDVDVNHAQRDRKTFQFPLKNAIVSSL